MAGLESRRLAFKVKEQQLESHLAKFDYYIRVCIYLICTSHDFNAWVCDVCLTIFWKIKRKCVINLFLRCLSCSVLCSNYQRFFDILVLVTVSHFYIIGLLVNCFLYKFLDMFNASVISVSNLEGWVKEDWFLLMNFSRKMIWKV